MVYVQEGERERECIYFFSCPPRFQNIVTFLYTAKQKSGTVKQLLTLYRPDNKNITLPHFARQRPFHTIALIA